MSGACSVSGFSEERRVRLLVLARSAIEAHLEGVDIPPPPIDDPALLEPRACFVTLRMRVSGALRGCRGAVRTSLPLAESVTLQAIAAATDDPRFAAVELHELESIAIHISVLTPPEPIEPAGIVLGRHGLVITSGGRSGLLLPQVPVLYGLRTVPDFLHALCRKAGLPARAWKEPGTQLLGFEAETWAERQDDATMT